MKAALLLTCISNKSFSTAAFSLFSCAFSSDWVSVSSESIKDNFVRDRKQEGFRIFSQCLLQLQHMKIKYLSHPLAGLQDCFSYGIKDIVYILLKL